MLTTHLSSKGQLVLPKVIRDQHHWTAGTLFTVEDNGSSLTIRPIKKDQIESADDLLGSSGYKGPRLSISDMDKALEQGAKALK